MITPLKVLQILHHPGDEFARRLAMRIGYGYLAVTVERDLRVSASDIGDRARFGP